MFRYSLSHALTIHVKDFLAGDDGAHTAAASPSTSTAIRSGEVVMMRQRAFKFEKLVPVVPTRYVLVNIPWCSSADIDHLGEIAACNNGSVVDLPRQGCGQRRSLFSEVRDVICWIRSMLPTSVSRQSSSMQSSTTKGNSDHGAAIVFEVLEVLCDSVHGETLVVLDVGTSTRMLDVLDACDSVTERAASLVTSSRDGLTTFSPEEASNRRLVAFPCDPRPIPYSMEQEEFYAIPTCMMCCDRLDRSVSGIVANVCTCPDDSCACMFTSRCRACKASCMEGDRPCTECGVEDDTWVCLLCGYLGCSRYRAMHVTEHCQRHMHGYSLSLTTQQIWDYQSDRFVHRLVLNIDRAAKVSERMQFPEQPTEVDGGEATSSVKPHLPFPPTGGTSTKVYQGVPTAGKVLVDAKLDAKLEQCCANFSRELAAHLATQRNQYMAAIRREGLALPGTEASRSSAADAAPCGGVPAGPEAVDGDDVVFSTVAHSFKAVSDGSAAALKSWAALNDAQARIVELEQLSSATESQQRELKDHFRKLLVEDAEKKSAEDKKVQELEETIADLKLNLATKQRMMQRLGKGDQLGSAMAVLGSGSGKHTTNTHRKK